MWILNINYDLGCDWFFFLNKIIKCKYEIWFIELNSYLELYVCYIYIIKLIIIYFLCLLKDYNLWWFKMILIGFLIWMSL